MTDISKAGTFALGQHTVKRIGYGAMQLAGKGVFGPPKDKAAALSVLRQAVASGVDHIDTSDFYGPHVTNQLIREALHPYAKDLVIVTKVSARRGERGELYNLAQRGDDALIDELAAAGTAYVPFFPLGGFTPLQSDTLSAVAQELGATPLQVALAWLLHRAPNILLIPGTGSLGHLRENLAVANLVLPADKLAVLDRIASASASAE